MVENGVVLLLIMQDVAATYYLGVCHERGFGTGRNKAKAADLYRRAASRGHAEALHNLAVFFEHGIGGLQSAVMSSCINCL